MTEHKHTDAFPIHSRAADSTPVSADVTPTGVSGRVPAVGDLLPRAFGRYELRRLLGAGGMGRVYLAHDPQLDRLVALKMPNPVAVDGWRERFFAEARAAATLTHPNVCPVYDVGEEDGQPFLTMAYIEGETLAAKLARERSLDPDAAVALVSTVARAMEEAHRRGIVHRDLKPANLMLDPAGRPVVMDFGLAIRSTAADDLRLTLTGVALGTPAYMPPEQAGGDADAIGPAADVYAMGVMLYELVTGRVPFKAKSFGKLLAQIERDAPPAPSALNPSVEPALEAVILTCLAKRPADRFASAGDLADALGRYLEGDRRGLVSLYSRPFAVPGPTGEFHPAPSASAAAVRKPPNRVRWLARAAALLLLFTAVAAVIYVQTDYGEVEVRLSDPTAKVDVRVNGQQVALEADGRVTRVKVGKGQKLEVSGPDFETVAESFDLKRGGVTIVQVRLKPKPEVVQKKPVEPKPVEPKPVEPNVGNKPAIPDLPVPIPEGVAVAPMPREVPSKPVPYPSGPTLIEVAGWQVLTDATKEEMQKWLDERKKAKHSVMWLDAYTVDGRPAFAAIAALDDRQPGWAAMLDESADDVNAVKPLDKSINTSFNSVVSISGYLKGEQFRAAILWHPGARQWAMVTNAADGSLDAMIVQAPVRGYVLRSFRAYPSGEARPRYAVYFESIRLAEAIYKRGMTLDELTDFLAQQRKDGFRPRTLSAVEQDGQVLFTALSEPNKDKWEWQTDTDLTAAALKTKAADYAQKGFRPSCVTAYPWDGAVRYCVVWAKEPPKDKEPPKKP